MSSVDRNGDGRSLLRVDDLQTHFSTEAGTVAAVDRISFEVAAGESVGVVGESGCGKTITSLSIIIRYLKSGSLSRNVLWIKFLASTT